jgi:hypothetical protein
MSSTLLCKVSITVLVNGCLTRRPKVWIFNPAANLVRAKKKGRARRPSLQMTLVSRYSSTSTNSPRSALAAATIFSCNCPGTTS